MGIQDLIITPIYLLLFVGLAHILRDSFSNRQTRKYFILALLVRFFGAIMLGVIYQFYYGGGDTFNFWSQGSEWILNAFWDDPIRGWQLLTKSDSAHLPHLYEYSQHIWYYSDPASYFIIRITTIFDFITFHTYSATALFFAIINFSGMWAFFTTVQRKYPHRTKWLALGILFFPSVVFWGSGILKDTITLAALGWMSWALLRWVDFKMRSWKESIAFALSFWVLLVVKIYILICFIPVVSIWLLIRYMHRIRNKALKVLIAPMLIMIFVGAGYFVVIRIGADNAKYSLDNIAEQARITAYDIRYGWGARDGGDGGYDLGDLDGTWQNMIRLMPAAINVSLFRPYIWEVKNPLMLLVSIESMTVMTIVFYLLIFRNGVRTISKDPFLIFCTLFVLLFAFAVGVSTYNFGTLMRYKIPMIPFFSIVLAVATNVEKSK